MLYLTRKIGQSVIINDKIEVQVTEIKGKTVKLGFIFPEGDTILRKEIHAKVHEENQQATDASSMLDFLQDISVFSVPKKPKSDE